MDSVESERDPRFERHPLLLARFNEYEIVEARFFVLDEEHCLDLTLRRDEAVRRFRFIGCRDVKFRPTDGASLGSFPCLFDVSSHGLEDLKVAVADEDATSAMCDLYLWAKDVADLDVPGRAACGPT